MEIPKKSVFLFVRVYQTNSMSILDFDYGDDDLSSEQNFKALIYAFEHRNSNAYFDVDSLEEIALHYFECGKHEQSFAVIDQILASQPLNARIWLLRGILLGNLNRPKEAQEAFKESLSLNPSDSEATLNLGVSLEMTGPTMRLLTVSMMRFILILSMKMLTFILALIWSMISNILQP